MRQIIMNLITNAAEAIGDARGSVLVHIHARSACQQTPTSVCVGNDLLAQRAVLIEVCDDGPGIPAADRQRIFEPFFSTKDGGRGLGLAAVQGIVQAHKGIISIDESSAGGARLRVFLPADLQSPTDAPPARSVLPDPARPPTGS